MSESCEICARARDNPDTGLHDVACRGCRVRMASMAPRFARVDMVEKEAEGGDAQFGTDVVTEFTRRQAWRRVNAS